MNNINNKISLKMMLGRISKKRFLLSKYFSSKIKKGEKYILAIDQGTTSSRALLVSKELEVVAVHQESHTQITPHPGWVSHSPTEIYSNVLKWITSVMSQHNITKSEISWVGITNQRETTVAWDKVTGEPIQDAIVWLDKRTQWAVDDLLKHNSGKDDAYKSITGLPISTYFSGVKMKWMLSKENEHREKIKRKIKEGRLAFGTIDSWLIRCLSGQYITDSSNASRTLLMNLSTLEWDQKMLSTFGVHQECLPEIIKESSSDFAIITEPILKGVPITGVLGDQQSACLGHLLQKGEIKNTYGTGCFMLLNSGDKIIQEKGLLSTVLYKLGKDQPTNYAVEGAVEWGGSTIEWAKNKMNLFKDFDEFNQLLSSVKDHGGVYFIPAFSGLFSPYWRNDVRGTIYGLSLHTERAHILKAMTNSILMRWKEVIDVMEHSWAGELKISKIYVDGGVSLNPILMQTQSDFLGKEVITKEIKELTAIGVSIAAGLKVGVWSNLDEIKGIIKIKDSYKPQISEAIRQENEGRWKQAVQKSMGWSAE